MNKKNIFKFSILFIGIIAITAFIVYNNLLNKKFIQLEVNSIIVKRNNWQLRTTEFYLRNGLRIDSTFKNKLDLKVGDSITKKANSSLFTVYRKEDGKFKHYKENILK